MKAVPKPLDQRVLETMSRYNMAAPGLPLGVAVSGGPDSTALLHLLHARFPVTVLHLNHGLRGEESARDEEFVRAAAAALGVPCLVEHVRPDQLAGNLEENGRRLRYEFFARARAARGLHRVATGHTRDDQAETVLLRLLRGAGPGGLAAIRPVTREGTIRPLLDVSRAEIESWLAGRGIAWRQDASNEDMRFDRNRVRHQLLPQLEREWNPRLADVLARAAAIARDEEIYWDAEMARLLERFPPGLPLPVAALGQLPPALLRRLLRAMIERERGHLRGVGWEHVERILDLVRRREGTGSVTLPGLRIRRSFDSLHLAVPAPASAPYRLELPVPGTVELPGGGRLSASMVQARAGNGYNTVAGIDWSRRTALVVRAWQPGDRYRPRGHDGPKKLKDLFQEGKVPSWERALWPIIEGEGRIWWSRRFGPALEVSASPASSAVVEIQEDFTPGGATG